MNHEQKDAEYSRRKEYEDHAKSIQNEFRRIEGERKFNIVLIIIGVAVMILTWFVPWYLMPLTFGGGIGIMMITTRHKSNEAYEEILKKEDNDNRKNIMGCSSF